MGDMGRANSRLCVVASHLAPAAGEHNVDGEEAAPPAILAMIPHDHKAVPDLKRELGAALHFVTTAADILSLPAAKRAQILVVVHNGSTLDGPRVDTLAELRLALQPGSLPELRWVHTLSAGVDHLPHALLAAHIPHAVALTHNQGVSDRSLAEFAVLGCLHFAKQAPRMASQLAAKHWDGFFTRELGGATIGVVGLGSIGSEVLRMAIQGFGMKGLGLRRASSEVPHALAGLGGLTMLAPGDAGLAQLVRDSDYVVLCLPQTEATSSIIGARELWQMKSGAVLVNIGRGTAVDCDALADVLSQENCPLGGAALDVTAVEPLPASHGLWKVGPERLLLSPHTMDLTTEYWPQSVVMFMSEYRRHITGEALKHTVDLVSGY
jgi:glyoxylate/hydroxypyruvate reductase A